LKLIHGNSTQIRELEYSVFRKGQKLSIFEEIDKKIDLSNQN
jgi:hypothetical protein